MKKRKELDALLLNNMNGKKIGKSSGSGKEGHELLRNEASWDSNSTENDEFFSPPRRLTIRKPHRWRFCATGIQLCVFVVMVACIVVTSGLVWMHLDLKQDLDELRLRIAEVESGSATWMDQASTLSTLQQKVEQIQQHSTQISTITRWIEYLNSTSRELQAKVKAVQGDIKAVRDDIKAPSSISIEGLQQSTAQIGSTMQGVQSTQMQHAEQIDRLTSSLGQLQASLAGLQGDVSKLQQAVSVPTPGPGPGDPTSDTGRVLHIPTAIQSLQQGQNDTSAVVSKLNSTVASLQLWQQDLMPRITALESTAPDSSLAEKVTQLQLQVNTLMGSIHSQTSDGKTGVQTQSSIASGASEDWRQEIVSEIQAIQKRLDELNPRDLNNNLLNENVTRGLQHQIERSLSVFKAENLKSVDDLKEDNKAILARLDHQNRNITDIQQEVDDLLLRVQDLENKEGDLTAAGSTAQRPPGH